MENDITQDISDQQSKPLYGGFWIRFVAIMIDSIILLVVGSVLQLFLGAGLLVSLINHLLSLGYYVFLESGAKQGTIGKMVMDLKVVDTSYQRISVPRALGRYFSKMIAFIPMMIGVFLNYDAVLAAASSQVDISELTYFSAGSSVSSVLAIIFFGMAAFHSRKQTLHDRIAKTYVIRQA